MPVHRPPAGRDSLLGFEPFEDPPGVEVVDRIDRRRYRLHTSGPVDPTPADGDAFLFPVDRAVRVTTEAIVLPTTKTACVRDADGEMVTEVGHLDTVSFDGGTHLVELNTQIRTYLLIDGAFEIASNVVETRLDLDGERDVLLGAVSSHDRPAATVTTPADPVEMMCAVSAFGSALKTTTPERSIPSYRGHPPAVELGEELDVPATVDAPDTGVRLEVPATYEAVYTVAPLAYYLGATVVQGTRPRLATDAGFEEPLDAPGDLETGVRRTLERVFTLDCVTRTEGIYEVPLHERRELDARVDLDWAALYHRPLAEQVATYLDVSYSLVEDVVPEWRLTVHVDPAATTVEHLPFVVDDLALVRTGTTTRATSPETNGEPTPAGEGAFSRSATDASTGGTLVRSTTDASTGSDRSYVQPRSSSLEQAWIGDRIPVGASKLTTEAFQNRLERSTDDGDITITVVVNDDRMSQEGDIVDGVYGERADLPFDVSVRRTLTVDALRSCLQSDHDFLHFVGHVDRDGIRCADGQLDASTLSETGVDSFLLNACNSYRHGLHLIEGGAIGGIVTLNDVVNAGAVRIGETVARLLHAGFPLRAALTIAREEHVFGGQYIVVGDGGMTVTQAASRTPNVLDVTATDDGFDVEITTYATDDAGLGGMYKPHISDNEAYFLTSGTIATFSVTREELATFFGLENVPVRTHDGLRWSASLDVETLE